MSSSSGAPRDGLFDGADRPAHVSLDPKASGQVSLSAGARRRLLGVGFGLCALIASTYLLPPLRALRPWVPGEGYVPFWNLIGRELLGEGEQLAKEQAKLRELAERSRRVSPTAKVVATGRLTLPGASRSAPGASSAPGISPPADGGGVVFPPLLPSELDQAPEVVLEDREALESFYRKLTLADLGVEGAIARAGQWGDSILGDDGLSHAIRSRLQARFGDAGHGFHVLGRYNLAYLHRGVRYRDREGWTSRCEIIFKCERDGHYGYGGVSTRSSGGGTAEWKTTREGLGSRVSRFELWYAEFPEGGDFQIKVDGEVARVVNTQAERLGDGFAVLEVPDGPHEFEVRAIGGAVRGYGVVLERGGPGVVWDSLALIGSFTQRLDYQDPEHIASQIARRDLDLLVFTLGGNDVQREKMDLYRSMEPYETEYDAVIRKFRAGKPEASCLVTSLTDHGERVGARGVRTRRIVPKLVESQRKVAKQRGCAFFDTFAAMGGEGAVERWYRSNPQLIGADLGHPTSEGHEVLATLLYQALMHGYAEYRARMVGKPLPELQPR